MKKILWTVLLGMIVAFTSCQNEDDFSTSETTSITKSKTFHFYGVKSVENETELRGVGQLNKLWHNGTTITVKLLNDPYNMSESIQTWASEWERYANINFEFVTSGNAEVRIGFDWNDSRWVTWSYTGTDCKYIRNQSEATVNFAFWDMANETEKKADVLRAFGQVLGLELEYRHLSFDPGWSTRIQQYWEGEIEDIPWEELREYVFDPIEQRNLIQTDEYDPNSIMIWPFDRRYAANTAREFNYELSEQDIEFIQQLYPGREIPAFTFRVAASRRSDGIDNGFACDIITAIPTVFQVDFGDGNIEYASTEILEGTNINYVYFSRYYPNNEEGITVKVFGDSKIITFVGLNNIDLGHESIHSFDISPCINLTEFHCGGFKQHSDTLVSLDLSKNSKLEIFSIYNGGTANDEGYFSGLVKIDFGNNVNLNKISLTRCENLMDIDISECPNLRNIFFTNHTGLLSTEESLIRFANALPTRIGIDGILSHRATWGSTRYNLDCIYEICESKGWLISR